MNFLDRFFPLLAKGEMAQQNRRVKAQRIHIFTSRGVDLARPSQDGALSLSFRRRDYVRNTHELQ